MPDKIIWKKALWGIGIVVVGVPVFFVVLNQILDDLVKSTVWFWAAGAGALGLVSGFITGLSTAEGSGKAFITFLGTGLLVPILGGVGAFLGQTESVTETSTYLNDHLIKKTTDTVTSFSDGDLLHPLAVLGLFFLAFTALAIVGIVGGVLLRKGKLLEVMATKQCAA